MEDRQVRNWASFRVAKTGQLRIPVFLCRLGHFGKIELGTDFGKTAPLEVTGPLTPVSLALRLQESAFVLLMTVFSLQDVINSQRSGS